MPIYEYRRPDGSTFEIVQSFSDDPLTHDPDTGVPVQRVLHAPAVHFKGSGFYNTDYGTRKRQRENAAGSGEESQSGKKESADGAAGSGDEGKTGESKPKAEQSAASASGTGTGTTKSGPTKKKPVPTSS